MPKKVQLSKGAVSEKEMQTLRKMVSKPKARGAGTFGAVSEKEMDMMRKSEPSKDMTDKSTRAKFSSMQRKYK